MICFALCTFTALSLIPKSLLILLQNEGWTPRPGCLASLAKQQPGFPPASTLYQGTSQWNTIPVARHTPLEL